MSILNKLFGKNKKPSKEVSGYNEAIKMINFYIATFEWEKAKQAIEEIKQKEEKSYIEVIEKLDTDEENPLKPKEKEKQKLKKEYDKKIKEITLLKEDYHKKQEIYNNEQDKNRFKIRFKNIEEDIVLLSSTGKNLEALDILNKFLEENKDKKIVVDFFNKHKKIINKNIIKQKEIEEKKIKDNTILEAQKLIGEYNLELQIKEKKEEEKTKDNGFLSRIKEKLNYFKKIKQARIDKKMLDEINMLIDENDKNKEYIASSKLENIHKGLVKEIFVEKMLGYDFYGKILGANKIAGDTFGFSDKKDDYIFFIGDATGHGIRAGFIVTMLSKAFFELVGKKDFKNMIFKINNSLKQDLSNKNFITSIFFEINKKNLSDLSYVGMGHEPILIYKTKTKKVEKLNTGGLAAGIRIIKNIDDIKIKNMHLDDGDIVFAYSDGIIEAKSETGEHYSIDRLMERFEKLATEEIGVKSIYEQLMLDLKYFKGGTVFADDITFILLQRNSKKDIVSENSNYIRKLQEQGKIEKKDIDKYTGKSKQEIENEIEKNMKKKKIKNIIANLKSLYLSGEIIKLKEESIRFIKEGFIDPKINFYLKKAIENEQKYKIEQKQQKMENKYKVLQGLMKKGDYSTVVRELEDIIGKDGNI